jgi:hypothetical protein
MNGRYAAECGRRRNAAIASDFVFVHKANDMNDIRDGVAAEGPLLRSAVWHRQPHTRPFAALSDDFDAGAFFIDRGVVMGRRPPHVC